MLSWNPRIPTQKSREIIGAQRFHGIYCTHLSDFYPHLPEVEETVDIIRLLGH